MKDEFIEQARVKTKEILSRLGIEGDIEVVHQVNTDSATIAITTPEARLLIGEKGQNLLALEHIVKKLLAKEMEKVPSFSLDVNGYRATQLEGLRDEVKMIAKKVRLYRKEIRMRPMRAHERRVIHMALTEYPDITTESIGDDPQRLVIIKPYP